MHKAIKNKRPRRLWSGVIILHDNARPHVAKVADPTNVGSPGPSSLQSRSVTLRVSHMFDPLKKNIMGQQFHTYWLDLKAGILNWFNDHTTSFFVGGIRNLPK
ncbi:hypothetical protein TNCV_4724411 [Trichonephila clavipes]|uniref:Transposase n=1 Tax=Trichonephila clavipes TaxID=2585209 RepID=A0A8X7BFI2_TRICX|nr:hypothetical protein TNCV_4724411 [Trichonephila clavipes]